MARPHSQRRRIKRPPQGRPVDRLIVAWALFGLALACLATLWFFAGFVETDPDFAPASSAFLLSLLLGAFAILPCALIWTLARRAYLDGFQLSQGLWSLFLILPWFGLASLSLPSVWMPIWLSLIPAIIGLPIAAWAITSLILELHVRLKRNKSHK